MGAVVAGIVEAGPALATPPGTADQTTITGVYNGYYSPFGSTQQLGAQFTPGTSGALTGLVLAIDREICSTTGSTAGGPCAPNSYQLGDLTVLVYSTNAAGTPASYLATAIVPQSSIPVNDVSAAVDVDFNNQPDVSAGTPLDVVLSTQSGSGSNFYRWHIYDDPKPQVQYSEGPTGGTGQWLPSGSYSCTNSCPAGYNAYGLTDYIGTPKASQTVSFTSTPPANPQVGGGYAPAATGGGSGNPVIFSVDKTTSSVCSIGQGPSGGPSPLVIFGHVGTCTVDANQAGNNDYQAAPQVQQTFGINQAVQTISFTSSPPTNPQVGGNYAPTATGGGSGSPVVFSVDAVSGSACSVSNATVIFDHVGTCTVDANQGGNNDYQAAPQVQQTFGINQAVQAISFTSSPPTNPQVGGNYAPAATGGGSGSPVVFSVDAVSGSACSVSNATVIFDHVGTCTVDANQGGNGDYQAAPQVQQTLRINQAPTAISAASITVVGSAATGSVTMSARLTSRVTGSGLAGKSVSFSMSSAGGEVGCSAVTDSAGAASCSVGFAQAAPVLLQANRYSASYRGDTDYGPSTGGGSVKLA
jgi:hypothetical protein